MEVLNRPTKAITLTKEPIWLGHQLPLVDSNGTVTGSQLWKGSIGIIHTAPTSKLLTIHFQVWFVLQIMSLQIMVCKVSTFPLTYDPMLLKSLHAIQDDSVQRAHLLEQFCSKWRVLWNNSLWFVSTFGRGIIQYPAMMKEKAGGLPLKSHPGANDCQN